MGVTPSARKKPTRRDRRELPPPQRVIEAFQRLARHRALHTLIRGAVPIAVLKRLLKDALPREATTQLPDEVWSGLATGIALESPIFGLPLAQALHDHLAWDREPADLDGWWHVVRERPLEALWMAALSEDRSVRKEFPHLAGHCLDNFRASPQCVPPSWEFVEALNEVQAKSLRELREAEKRAEEAERRWQTERERLDELREELKRLRRETSDLRGERAQAERRIQTLTEARRAPAVDDRRVDELERRLRKAEKEREHLVRELDRLRDRNAPLDAGVAPPVSEEAAEEAAIEAETGDAPEAGEDPNPRRRVLRQIVRRLFNKGKIGASHTHEDNVYRGVADHEKGVAKDVMDLLYREGLLVPKPTLTDPHVSLSPDRTGEIRAIIEGDIRNPRLSRFIEGR